MADIWERVRIFEKTMELCRKDPALYAAISESISKQTITWEEDPIPPAGESRAVPANLVISPDRTLAAARKYISPGKRVCILNFASSVTPGGGVVRGASAQEESLCRISTLYAALTDRETAEPFYQRHRELIDAGRMGRKNRDDCIYTPGIVAIREDDFDCALLPEEDRYSVDVITCAAPDQRYDGRNTYEPEEDELIAVFEQRWKRILSVAAENKADILILGAFGCGAFQNPPEAAARAFSNIFSEYANCFETVEFAVFTQDWESPNYQAFAQMEGIKEAGQE